MPLVNAERQASLSTLISNVNVDNRKLTSTLLCARCVTLRVVYSFIVKYKNKTVSKTSPSFCIRMKLIGLLNYHVPFEDKIGNEMIYRLQIFHIGSHNRVSSNQLHQFAHPDKLNLKQKVFMT